MAEHFGSRPEYSQAVTEYSGFWIRVVAAIIDAIILGVITGVLSFIDNLVVSTSISTIIGWIYYSAMTATRGQTLGKMVVGVKVTTVDGHQPDWTVAIIREVPGKIISGIVFGLGYLWVAFDSKKQGWHDKIAKTYVVPAGR
jgi:uncharacterized RDD family membrane protein YckC